MTESKFVTVVRCRSVLCCLPIACRTEMRERGRIPGPCAGWWFDPPDVFSQRRRDAEKPEGRLGIAVVCLRENGLARLVTGERRVLLCGLMAP